MINFDTDELLTKSEAILEGAKDMPKGMTAFQLRQFVVLSEPTSWGQYAQACREISVRSDTLRTLKRARLEGRKGLWSRLKRALGLMSTPPDKTPEEREIERELKLLVELAEQIAQDLPPGTSWEDDSVQAEYWTMKLLRQAWAAHALPGVPAGICEAVACLPEAHKALFMDRHMKSMVETAKRDFRLGLEIDASLNAPVTSLLTESEL